jgi:glutaminyl-peptide cyclotransferase
MKHVNRTTLYAIGLIAVLFTLKSCTDDIPPTPSKTKEQKSEVIPPPFDMDSAFAFVKKQVDFGPRVPGTAAHKACGNWIVQQLKNYGFEVIEQTTTAQTWDEKTIPVRNIIGHINPTVKKRVMLAAHWDTRAYADKDSLKSFQKTAIDGANDGASGVAVILEFARMLHNSPSTLGIDLVFFDAEDNGAPEWASEEAQGNPYFWCLGSQYWAKNKHIPNYTARYGILLDMVGAKNARFNKEGYSMQAAPELVNKIWTKAGQLGYGELFQDQTTGEIIDDHVFMNQGGVRSIDIVDMRPTTKAMGFGGYEFGGFHHTHKDNLEIIDRQTLKAVGHTVSFLLYN